PFRIVYTTNYDRWLEAAFEHHGRPYAKIVSVADLPGIRPDVTQIVKFHGDFADEASIVLDESSYFRRLDFESPLDIKLRADALGLAAVAPRVFGHDGDRRAAAARFVYVGTYTASDVPPGGTHPSAAVGISVFRMSPHDGGLSLVQVVTASNPSYLALNPS